MFDSIFHTKPKFFFISIFWRVCSPEPPPPPQFPLGLSLVVFDIFTLHFSNLLRQLVAITLVASVIN